MDKQQEAVQTRLFIKIKAQEKEIEDLGEELEAMGTRLDTADFYYQQLKKVNADLEEKLGEARNQISRLEEELEAGNGA